MSEEGTLFSDDDDQGFVIQVSEHLKSGAAQQRGISAAEYIDLCRSIWRGCPQDEVFVVKILIDPLVQPEMAAEVRPPEEETGSPFCLLIAAIDDNGALRNAPPGYEPPDHPYLSTVAAGSALGDKVPDPSIPCDYLIAYFDVLGFEALLRSIGLKALTEKYQELLSLALSPNSEDRPWSQSIAIVRGQPQPALMYLPIKTAYFSDSLLLWCPYHPGNVHEFLDRCSRVFCASLDLGLPIRGAIAIGKALLDKERGLYLGLPLVEAVRAESASRWVGVALSDSWKDEQLRIPVPPDRVQIYKVPRARRHRRRLSGLALDWPRTWRDSRGDSPVESLKALRVHAPGRRNRAKYDEAIKFCRFSDTRAEWFLEEGQKVLRLKDPLAERGKR